MKKIIELWKTECGNCEAVKPTIVELEKEGYSFEKYNIASQNGEGLTRQYKDKIIENNKKNSFPLEYLFTPTFINPESDEVLAFEGRAPSKKELVEFAGGKFENGQSSSIKI